jgi:endonuclease/exonuclease/phosphatase family metal-dependent hydrolase
MGDFNTDWQEQHSALRMIVGELGLKAYRPEEPGLETFPPLGKRLDWILVSPPLEFTSYTVLPDKVSDHLGVIAQVAITAERRVAAYSR